MKTKNSYNVTEFLDEHEMKPMFRSNNKLFHHKNAKKYIDAYNIEHNIEVDFSKTEIADIIKPYHIIYKDGVKIGVVGANVSPYGLIASTHYEGMKFLPPTETINKTAAMLRNELKCDMVVCLSHLGIRDELQLAEKSRNVDIIIGGHSHTFMSKPSIRNNLDGKEVLVFQTNGRGVYVGRIDVELEKTKKN